MEELRDGQIEVGFVHKGLDEFMARLDAALNRLVVALVVVGGLIGSSLIGIFARPGPQVLGVNILSCSASPQRPPRGLAAVGRYSLGAALDTSTRATIGASERRRAPRAPLRLRSSALNGFWMYAVPGCSSSCCSIRSPV